MKWTEEEINLSVQMLQSGKTYDDIANFLGRTKKSIKLKLNKLNYFITDFSTKDYHIEKGCPACGKKFTSYKSENRIYCSQSCSAIENNKKRGKIILNNCLNCEITTKNKFCSHDCQWDYNKKIIYERIEMGDEHLHHKNYRKYLIDKYGDKCMICGWGEKNPITNKVPIEMEHIDGNYQNNSLENLKLLCPNCHSLTPTYKGLNRGNGRFKRMERKNNGKSF